jgi:hypothetical protein
MSEADEVAASIYEKHKASWPLTRKEAVALAKAYLSHESQQVQDNVTDALMELNQ